MDILVLPQRASDHQFIDMGQMMEKIAVQRPYFAFDSLYRTSDPDWDIWGDFNPEQSLGNEVGPLAIAEAGRHLAILGSCAAALAQPADERVYYLAIHAVWKLSEHPPATASQSILTARARVTERSRKKVQVQTELLSAGCVIGELKVDYQVLSEKLFGAIFDKYRIAEDPHVFDSPYRRVFSVEVVKANRYSITACSTDFSAAQCPGHFPHYPMWPVAAVVYGLTQVLSKLLARKLRRPFHFTVLSTELNARQLVSASEQLRFRAALKSLSRKRRTCRVRCCAYAGTKLIAELTTQLAFETTRKPSRRMKSRKG